MDANHGETLLGWDTDEFPYDVWSTTLAMYEVLENGGIAPGGINFDSKLRRTSTDMSDILLAHISGMDTFARALKGAARLKNDGFFDDIVNERYKSYSEGIGKSIVDGTTNLKELANYAVKHDQITVESNHLEYIKSKVNDYLV